MILASFALTAFAALPTAGAMTDSVLTVDSVRISGPGSELMGASAAAIRGTRLDSTSIRLGLEAMVDSAAAQGFLTASATATMAAKADSGTILDVSARTGTRLVWDRLSNAGSARLNPTAISRIGRIPTGAPAAPSDLAAAQRRLLQTGYVEAIAPPSIRRSPRTAKAEGILHLRELASSYIEAAAGWSRGEDTKGYLETRLVDLAGTARDLEFGISQGDQGTLAHAHWKEPWLGSLDARLDLDASLANDSLSQALVAGANLVWNLLDGRFEVGVGLTTARRSESAPGDSNFGPVAREFGSKLVLSWRNRPPSVWPIDDFQSDLFLDAVGIESDTGDGLRLRVRTGLDGWKSAGPVVFRLGAKARGIWPLDQSAGLSEALAPGGISGWRGWPEGSPRSPSWFWLTFQTGIGSSSTGGTFAFWEPGVRALRRQDLTWSPEWGWSAGSGFSVQIPAWQIDLVLAGRDDTPSWQDALLQVRARNRF